MQKLTFLGVEAISNEFKFRIYFIFRLSECCLRCTKVLVASKNAAQGIATGDFNEDGVLDLVTATTEQNFVNGNGVILIHFGKGDGTFPSSTKVDSLTASVDAGMGIAVIASGGSLPASNGSLCVYLGDGKGQFFLNQR